MNVIYKFYMASTQMLWH